MRVEKSWRLVRGLVSIFLTTLRLNAWIALDPTPAMVERSLPRTTQVAVPIEVIVANAEALPFPDHTFDTVVGTLVFCTIPDPCQALCEMRRICKPAGKVLFFEHVRVHHPLVGRLQDWLTPLWKRMAGGCHFEPEHACAHQASRV